MMLQKNIKYKLRWIIKLKNNEFLILIFVTQEFNRYFFDKSLSHDYNNLISLIIEI